MGKLKSLERLYELGFNIPTLLYSAPQFLSSGDKYSLWDSVETTPGIKLSIRTERDGERVCPHYPNITRPMANKKIKQLASKGYAIHVFEGIDPDDCLRRGTFRATPECTTIEWLEGPGTVRDLEHNPVNHLDLYNSALIPTELLGLCQNLGKKPSLLQGNILEWSQYNKPVGKKSQPFIYWELRPWR